MRKYYLNDFISLLPGDVEIFSDTKMQGIWWNAQRCWASGEGYDMLGVVQDDIIFHKDFKELSVQAFSFCPGKICSFFNFRKNLVEAAQKRGDSWYGYFEASGQCNYMPVEIAKYFLEFTQKIALEKIQIDDLRLSIFCAVHNLPIWYLVPGLCNTRKSIPSTHGFTGRFDSTYQQNKTPVFNNLGLVSELNKQNYLSGFESYKDKK